MKHYKVNDSEYKDIIYVPIDDILIQKEMLYMLEKRGYMFDKNKMKMDNSKAWLGNLNNDRLNNILKGINENSCIPPIQVKFNKAQPEKYAYVPRFMKKIMEEKGQKPRIIEAIPESYSVINGRHRVVASILSRFTHIPVIITEI